MKSQKVNVSFKLSQDLANRIDSYCKMKRINSKSDFFRMAAINQITPDVSDENLVFESLKDLHNKMRNIESQQDVTFAFFCSFFRLFLIYNPELPIAEKEAAAISSMQRFDAVFSSFRESLKDTPSFFESLLADFFEVKND